jgi:NADH:ubiquinone oxidoreductase subunit H
VLVLAPLAIETGSLRLHDIVFAQQQTFSPFSWLPIRIGGKVFEVARDWRWPDWNLFAQPLTALLFVPALAGLTHRPWIYDAAVGSMGTSGFGLDSDPGDLHWGRLEMRLSKVLAASLFVSLFLGAGAIPFVQASAIVDLLEPFVGPLLPALLGVMIQIGVFSLKLLVVLILASSLRRATATLRGDQWIEIVIFRLLPLAWANLLLMSAISLLSNSTPGGA